MFDEEYRGQLERGNIRGAIILPLATRAHQLAFAAGDVAEAQRLVHDARDGWGQVGFDLLHMHAWFAELEIRLYEGRGVDAWAYCEEAWNVVHRRSLIVLPFVRMLVGSARGRCAAALARTGVPNAPHLRRAAVRQARRLERLRHIRIAPPQGWLIRAAVADQAGRRPAALALLDRAAAEFDAAGMPLFAAAARRCRGELMGGEAGGDEVSAAVALMAGRGVADPARFAEVHAPGFGPSSRAGS